MGDLMWEGGYSATTPRQVLQRSGVGQGSMYHHFPTKHALGVAALEHNCRATGEAAVESVEGIGDPIEWLTAYITAPREALKGCRVGRMTQDKAVMSDAELRAPVTAAFSEAHKRIALVVQAAIDTGRLPTTLDADRLAYLISATFQGGYVLAIAEQRPSPYEAACAGLLDLLSELTTHTHSSTDRTDRSTTGEST